MVDPAQPQDSWFFQDDDTHEPAPEPQSPRQAGFGPGSAPFPEPEEPQAAPGHAPSTGDLSLESTFLASDLRAHEPGEPSEEGSWLLDADAPGLDPSLEELAAPREGAQVREAHGPVSAEPIEIAFEPWLEEGGQPTAAAAFEEDARPVVLEGSWAEGGVPRPSIPIRPFRWLGLGGAAAALGFAALQLQGAFEAEQSIRPLAPEASIEFGVRLEGPERAGAEAAAADTTPREASPAPGTPRVLESIGLDSGAARAQGPGTDAAPAARPRAPRGPEVSGTPTPSVARALEPLEASRAEARRTLAAFDDLLGSPSAASAPALSEPAPSVFLRNTLIQGPARVASLAARAGTQQLLAASPLLALQQDFEVGEAYRTWFMIQTESLPTGAQLVADPYRRITWCVGDGPSETFVRERKQAWANEPAGAPVAVERAEEVVADAREEGVVAWVPDPLAVMRLVEEATGEPSPPWLPHGSELAPAPEASRAARPDAPVAASTEIAMQGVVGAAPVITGHTLLMDEPMDVASVFAEGVLWADQVGFDGVAGSPILWSRSQGLVPEDAVGPAPEPEIPVVGTLRRIDTDTWLGETPPAELFEGSERVATPRVGAVRVIMLSGELFEGRLEAVGQGRIWLRTSLGALSLETQRTDRVERIDPAQVATSGQESREHDYAGKPRVRVVAPGGVFSGRLLRQEGDAITLWEDGGYRITLHGARLEDPEEGAPVSLRRAED